MSLAKVLKKSLEHPLVKLAALLSAWRLSGKITQEDYDQAMKYLKDSQL